MSRRSPNSASIAMNRSIPLRAAAAAFAITALAACDDGLTEVNRNPNNPDRATAEQLFGNAVEATVGRAFGSGLHMDLTALWAQQYSEFLYTQEDVYELSDATVGGHWSNFYAGPLQDLQEVVEKG